MVQTLISFLESQSSEAGTLRGRKAESINDRVDDHSHPSGKKFDKLGRGKGFAQTPSLIDLPKKAGMIHYVFMMRRQMIYILNRNGIQARIPIETFKKL